jgi:hypothetical protein
LRKVRTVWRPRRLPPHAQAARSDQRSTGQVKAIWEKEKPTLQPLMQQMRQNHSAMKTLEASGPFDEAKTRALATQNSQTMIELQVEHARIKSEIMQILTPDQKTKLAQLEASHEANMGKHASAAGRIVLSPESLSTRVRNGTPTSVLARLFHLQALKMTGRNRWNAPTCSTRD